MVVDLWWQSKKIGGRPVVAKQMLRAKLSANCPNGLGAGNILARVVARLPRFGVF